MKITEILNTLKIGESAKTVGLDVEIKKLADDDIIVTKNGTSSKYINQPLPLSRTVLQADWKIVTKKIGFDKALQLIVDEKTVTVFYDGKYQYIKRNTPIYPLEISEGVWYEGKVNKEDFE